MRPLALDLYCCAGGVSVGLALAGFDVVGVDSNPKVAKYWLRGMARHAPPGCRYGFVLADALTVPLDGFAFIWASPPCQAHSSLRHLQAGKTYPDLIPQTRELLQRWGGLWCIENVPGAPLGGANLTMLCGTMFGLVTPDGRAELRRHRLFETSFSIPLRPACQHGHVSPVDNTARTITVTGAKGLPGVSHARACITVSGDRPNSANTPRRGSLSIAGHAAEIVAERQAEQRQRVICVGGGKAMSGGMSKPQGMLRRERLVLSSITGDHPDAKTGNRSASGRSDERQRFTTEDARAAMGIDWMGMKHLSQAIPPVYAEWIGRQVLQALDVPTPR